jgi:hypothetical protein
VGVMCKVGIIDCLVSGLCAGDRDSGEKVGKERKMKDKEENRKKNRGRGKKMEQKELNKLKFQQSEKWRLCIICIFFYLPLS